MIHINILDSYVSFDQVWTLIPQEILSNHQKGKMVKIRVLTKKGQFIIFDLTNDHLVWSMISRVHLCHLDLMTWSKTFHFYWIGKWNLQSTDQKSTVYWKVKLWPFGQYQMPRFTIHKNMSKCETCSSRNQRLKIWFWNLKFS